MLVQAISGIPCCLARVGARQTAKTARRKAATTAVISETLAVAALAVSLGIAALAATIISICG
jgi:hypothetical protein